MLAILEYKAGNQTSVRRALEHLGIACTITADPEVLLAASGVIFPGVGAAGQAMGYLQQKDSSGHSLAQTLAQVIHNGTPLLGICLGCQILLEHSEENNTSTLGLVPGDCLRFCRDMKDEDGSPIRIPHMGWNSLKRQQESCLLHDVPEDAEFYFVHGYYVRPGKLRDKDGEKDLTIATTRYGLEFCSIYGRDGLWAVQFHLEKSGRPGLQILRNFDDYCRRQGGLPHAQ